MVKDAQLVNYEFMQDSLTKTIALDEWHGVESLGRINVDTSGGLPHPHPVFKKKIK